MTAMISKTHEICIFFYFIQKEGVINDVKKLEREFYNRDSVTIAKELLGKYIVRRIQDKELIGMIVEVEAYRGAIDKAAHSYNNRRTNRNEIMYGDGGYAYVYIIYGMYDCMNVVCSERERPEAVLIRAIQPISGIEEMALNRYNKELKQLTKRETLGLTSGPGKLCRALKIDRSQNGEDLCGSNLYIAYGEQKTEFETVITKRINIAYAEEAVHFPWRFYIKDNLYVSRK